MRTIDESPLKPARTVVAQISDAKKRLDQFLAEQCPEKSRTQIRKMIDSQEVLVEGKTARPSYRIRGAEQIQVSCRESADWLPGAEPIPLEIVYEDEDLAVINKPAGMVVHRGAGVQSGTLVNALLHHFHSLSQYGGSDRHGIVHRLDKQTSGLIVVAKNDLCHRQLSEQFQSRQINKTYIGLVHGRIEQHSGKISSPIGRDRVHRVKMTTRALRSRQALTDFQVLERFPKFTLLQIHIQTGRTHQIRVHLSSINHPVVGDTLYGAPARIEIAKKQTIATLTRNFLHATRLELSHPRTHERLAFDASLPDELTVFLLRLRCNP